MLLPAFHAVHVALGIFLEEAGINKFLEVLAQTCNPVRVLLIDLQLLLHLVDPSHLISDLFLPLSFELLLFLDLGLAAAPLGAYLHEVVAVSFGDCSRRKR